MHPIDEGACDSDIVIDIVPVVYCSGESCLLDRELCCSRPVEGSMTEL